MIRLMCLCLACGVLAQISPTGCPQETTPPAPAPRGMIETSATSSVSGAVAAGTDVTLTASVAGDPAGVSFSWVQTQGTGVKLNRPDTSGAGFTAPSLAADQTLRFRVTTTNAAGDVGAADVSVAILADPNFGFDPGESGGGGGNVTRPAARAGSDQTVVVGNTVTLDGSASTGRNLSFRWRQTSGPTVALATPNASRTTFNAPGTVEPGSAPLVFELVVRDAQGLTARDTVAIRVRAADGGDGAATRVRIDTTLGSFTLQLEDELAPNTVANFLQYVDENFYDNTIIHRVVAGFVIQGGGFGVGLVRREPRDPIDSEASNGLSNVRTTVSMALVGGDPDSGTSQFFVNLVDNTFLDSQMFTVFAKVVEGMDVVDRIAGVQTATRDGFENVPITDIVVRDVVRLE